MNENVLCHLSVAVFYCLIQIVIATQTKVDIVQAVDDIHQRLIALDSNLDKLISDVTKLKLELSGQSGQAKSDLTPFVDILTIQRTQVTGGYNFSVTYRLIADEVKVVWFQYQPIVKVYDMEIDGNTKLTSALFNLTDYYSYPILRFLNMETFSELAIEFNTETSFKGDSILYNITVPFLTTNTSQDIVYQTGQNIALEVKYFPHDKSPQVNADVVNLNSWKFVRAFPSASDSNLIDVESNKPDLQEDRAKLTILTSTNYVSGLIFFSVGHAMPGSIVNHIMFQAMHTLRPDSAKFPFPDKYLHLVDNHSFKEDGVIKEIVQPGKRVTLHCLAYGLNITDIYWTRLNSDGSITNIQPDNWTSQEERTAYSFYNSISLWADSEFKDKTKYTCRAENIWGVNVVETFQVGLESDNFLVASNLSLFMEDFNETRNTPGQASKGSPSLNPLADILSVQRIQVPGGFSFKVTYRPVAEDMILVFEDYLSELESLDEPSSEDTKTSFVFYNVTKNSGPLFLKVFSPKLLSGIYLELSTDDVSQKYALNDNVTIPSLVIEPTGDIVYMPARNVSVQMYFQHRPEILPKVWADVVDLNLLQFYERVSPGSENTPFIDLPQKVDGNGKSGATLNFRTSIYPISGFIYFLLELKTSETLVKDVRYGMMKVLRPVTAPLPIPETFLHIKELQGWKKDGVTIVMIKPGGKVNINCHVFGVKPRVYWTRLNLNGSTTIIQPSAVNSRLQINPYYFESSIEVWANSTFTDKTIYTCVAQNSMNNTLEEVYKVQLESQTYDGLLNSTGTFLKPSDLNLTANTTVRSYYLNASSSFVEVINASRVKTDKGYYYSVTYRPMVEDLKVRWSNGTTDLLDFTQNNLGDYEVTKVFYDPKSVLIPHLQVSFESPQRKSAVVLTFHVLSLLPGFQVDNNVRIPQLDIPTNTDIVYDPGQNTTLKLGTTNENVQDIDGHMELVDVKTGAFMFSRLKVNDLKFIFVLLKSRPLMSKNGTEFDLTFLTSKKAVSGVLTFFIQQPLNGSVLHTIKISKQLTLRPADQNVAFPARFIFIREQKNAVPSMDINYQVKCRSGDMCLLQCTALGPNLKDVLLYHIHENGSKSMVQDHEIRRKERALYSYEVNTVFWVSLNDQLIRNFECVAKNIYGDTVSRNLVVTPVIQLDILSELSRVTILEAKGKTKTRYNITCVIRASRKPQVKLTFINNASERDHEFPADAIIQVSPHEYRVTKIKAFNRNKPNTMLTSVKCRASTPHEATELELAVPNNI